MTDKTAEEKKQFSTLEEVKEEEAKRAAGGYYVGSDKYTMEEYSKAGVTWEHNFWSKDRYFIRGVQIDQSLAERITQNSQMFGRLLTDDELRVLGVNL
ncbi:MAG: hypothetical protein PHR21_05115 [Oscillospiraceae bacterium]|nr:hypothetical protein [Oscillospiraceae bacterium]MDD4367636.1 hypothetical protein [Oscillospiraceae bacterium]